MKKSMFFLLCAFTFWACNNAENKKDEVVKPADNTSHHDHSAIEDSIPGEPTLSLNNGAKWNSDESTNNNVNNLVAIVDRFNEKKPVNDYSGVAAELQTGLDKLIQECRMQGADHDALHLWLEPLLGHVAGLKKAGNEKEAFALFEKIEQRLSIYKQYFE